MSLQPAHARTQDANHLRQIGLALNLAAEFNDKAFPPAVSPKSTLPPDERLSWLVLQLPYLEQRKNTPGRYVDLAGSLDLSRGFADPVNAGVRVPLRPYQSPAALPDATPPDFTSYIGITGVGVDAATLPVTDPNAGFFGYARVITRDNLLAGTSYTLVVADTTRGGSWGCGGPGTAVGIPAEGDDLAGRDRPLGGLHSDGFHVLFADGNVSFRKLDFPARLLRDLARINRAAPD
jgi:prepilin-type processing-associated H-X9-DG protein